MRLPRKPFIIAEIGINGNGDIDLAKKLIDVAKRCDCDAVKFQKRAVEICIPESVRDMERETPWGIMTYMEYKRRMEFGEDQYDEIDEYCKSVDIPWFASAWDLESLKFLKKYDCPYNKVASAMLLNWELLRAIAAEKKPTFISTGMSTLQDISKAVVLFDGLCCPFCLMHCNSTYPTAIEDCNINVVEKLYRHFVCDVGYSGHETGLLPSILAVAKGAVAVERHITLDRAMWGSDHAASLEPHGLELLVRDCRNVSKILGSGVKAFGEKEKAVARKQRYFLERQDAK